MNTLLLGKAFIQQMPTTYSIPRIVLRAETGKDKAHPTGACSVGRCWANAHTQGLGTARYISSLQSKDLSLWMNNLRHGKRVNCISKGATNFFGFVMQVSNWSVVQVWSMHQNYLWNSVKVLMRDTQSLLLQKQRTLQFWCARLAQESFEGW